MDFIQMLVEKGGIVMYPLFLLSVTGVYLIFRGFYIYRQEFIFPKNSRICWQNYMRNRQHNPKEIQPENESHGDRILLSFLNNPKKTNDSNDIENEILILRFKLENCLELLENVANIAPLFGLAGTVLGIIRIFQGRATEEVSSLMISLGISEALFTTITGLFIAIPCIMFHNVIRRRFNSVLIKIEADVRKILENKDL